MNHVMIDLETLGNTPGCIILSIGAIEFDPRTQTKGKSLYLIVNKKSCESLLMKTSEETLNWWTNQSEEAKTVLKKAESSNLGDDNVLIGSALIALSHFVKERGDNVKVWSCGADFDLPILVSAFEACAMPVPWKFWNSRCHRTIKSLAPWIKPKINGVAHNALDDASNQVDHLFAIAKALNLKIS